MLSYFEKVQPVSFDLLSEKIYKFNLALDRAVFGNFEFALESVETPPVAFAQAKKDTDQVVKDKTQEHWKEVVAKAKETVDTSKDLLKKINDEGLESLRTKVEKSRAFLQENGQYISQLDSEFKAGGVVSRFKPYIFQLKDRGKNISTITSALTNNYFTPKMDLIAKSEVNKEIFGNYNEALIKYAANGVKDFDRTKITPNYAVTKEDWKFSRDIYGKDADQSTKKALQPMMAFAERLNTYINKASTDLTTSMVKATSASADKSAVEELNHNGKALQNGISLLSEINSAFKDTLDISNDIYDFSSEVIESSIKKTDETVKQAEAAGAAAEKAEAEKKAVSNF